MGRLRMLNDRSNRFVPNCLKGKNSLDFFFVYFYLFIYYGVLAYYSVLYAI